MSTQELKRARTTALLLGAATIISLIFLITAYVHKERADQLQIEVDSLKQQIETMKAVGDGVRAE
jgi:hypothetical protein